MKHKKLGITVLVILVLSLICYGVYEYAFKTDATTTLTLAEKQWVENNKNKVFDLAITTDIPVFNYNGDGVFFDYLNSLEKEIELEFSKVSFNYGEESKSDYAFTLKDEVEEKDILLYEDTYSLIGTKNVKYNTPNDFEEFKVGVLESEKEKIESYLKGYSITYETYETIDELLEEIKKEDSAINGMILPQLVYFKTIVENENFFINYQLEGLTKKYVLSLGDNDKLNSILTKYYKKWSNEQFENSFNKHFSSDYFTFASVEEKDKVDFKSKRYTYGFVENKPYDALSKNKLVGINSNILRGFSLLADIEISYTEYSNMEYLLEAINENKVDFIYGMNADTEYDTDMYTTISNTKEEVVLVTSNQNEFLTNSLVGVSGKEVLAVKGTKISNYLSSNGVKVKEYNTVEEMLNHKSSTSILALDKNTYEYYARSELREYYSIYTFSLDTDYGYVIRDIQANKVFEEFFNTYLSFTNENTFLHTAYEDLIETSTKTNIFFTLILILVGLIIGLFAIFGMYKYIHVEKKQASLTKGDRIRYIDQLTSLKNRNYLNDNIETWDESEIYPQSIVIVDLNNIAYINDNYGHQEGDNVIKEAANVLIKSQIENSDIIRTNGNEFLIYLVGYDEKQIVSYIRKLNKELKELAHGFGAAIGYSMITDAIKTIDDAVNEATLDMRASKEENMNNSEKL